jgi:hypothetical protein
MLPILFQTMYYPCILNNYIILHTSINSKVILVDTFAPCLRKCLALSRFHNCKPIRRFSCRVLWKCTLSDTDQLYETTSITNTSRSYLDRFLLTIFSSNFLPSRTTIGVILFSSRTSNYAAQSPIHLMEERIITEV